MQDIQNRLAIFVDSFDGMSDVWKYYFQIINKYWPECKLHRYLVTNELSFETKNLEVIKTGEDKNWFTMTYKALSQVKEKYIFFMIEDDYMSEPADEEKLTEIIDYMEEKDIFFYRFTCPINFPQDKGFLEVYGDVVYPISVQPAIWRVEKLKEYLLDIQSKGCKSPWDFERYFIDLYKDCDKDQIIPGIRYDSRHLFGFKNGIIQGKWDPRIVKFYAKRGVYIDTKQRGTMPFKKVILDQIKRNKLIRGMSFEKQAKLKKVLKKLGIDFIT